MLKEDIFYAKIQNSGMQVRIRNTTTETEFNPTPATVALLDLCTGTNSIDEIIQTLSKQAGEPEKEVAEGVHRIVAVLQEKKIFISESIPS